MVERLAVGRLRCMRRNGEDGQYLARVWFVLQMQLMVEWWMADKLVIGRWFLVGHQHGLCGDLCQKRASYR